MMTDKQVRKLKKAELIETLFYLQKELESVKEENETLKAQIKAGVSLSEGELQKITDAVMSAVKGGNTAE